MALTFFWRLENSLTLDGTHDFSAGDTTATANGGATFSSDTAFAGTYAGDYPTDTDNHEFTVTSSDIWDNGAGYENVIAFSFYVDTWVAGGGLAQVVDSAVANNHLNITMAGTSGSGNISANIRVSGVSQDTVTTADNNIALTTWYSCIVRVDRTNTTLRIELYNASGTLIGTPAESTTINSGSFPTSIDRLKWGEYTGSSTDFHLDNVFVADTYAEAIEDYLDITSYTEYGVSASGSSNLTLLGVG